jgi:galactose oxidase
MVPFDVRRVFRTLSRGALQKLRGPAHRRRSRLPASMLILAMLALVGIAFFNRASGSSGGTDEHPHTPVPAAVIGQPTLSRAGWTVTADSQETTVSNNPATNVLDGNAGTIWHTKFSGTAAPLPHTLTIDMHANVSVGGLVYLPRNDGWTNGRVGQYKVEVSSNGTAWGSPVATGTFADDATVKTVVFGAVTARYVRLTALSEAGNRGQWTTAAEINLLGGLDPALPRTWWSATTDSQETVADNNAAGNVLDGNTGTMWHTKYAGGSPALPHQLTIDMHVQNVVSGLSYLPRQDNYRNGNVGQYRIQTSNDGVTWSGPVATGAFADNNAAKTVVFPPTVARYVRLTALTEAGNRGQWSSAAEINLHGLAGPVLPRAGWVVTADSQETVAAANPATNAVDGSAGTIWHTKFNGTSDPLPHTFTIDMRQNQSVGGLTYLPRNDGWPNGRIGQYKVEVSTNNTTWTTVATGTFDDDTFLKPVLFGAVMARYVRLTALTEAGNRGPWTTAAEINLLAGDHPTLTRAGWTVAVDSAETTSENTPATNTLDGNPATMWHTKYSGTAAPLPHTLTIDMHATGKVAGLSYLPRSDAYANGRIGQYKIEVSGDGAAWTTVANGTFADLPTAQLASFAPVNTRFVRLTALTEAGARGPWTSVAEIGLVGPGNSRVKYGAWGAPVGFPLVPVAVVLLPNGKVLAWSSYAADTFGGTGKTVMAVFDPVTRGVTQRTVAETGHDMFCPGISILPDGRVVVTGGDDSAKTSIYNPTTDAWSTGPAMKISRGYQSSVTLSDGRVFTIGGSWSGGIGGKAGEVWSQANGWQLLPGTPVGPILTNDAQGEYRSDNHPWLFAWSNGLVFHAGPSKAMNWFNPAGNGSTTPAGPRGSDGDAMNGTAVMYDAGKILTLGGAPSYQNSNATTNAFVITLSGTTATVRAVPPMANARAFHNSVVLPDGKVVVFGGQTYPVPFSDDTSVLAAELWDPATETFTVMAPAVKPRNYHSVAILLPDARVFTGGGGLCGTGCGTNHFDGEIFTPPNLLNPDGTPAPRPAITAAPTSAANGATITVATDKPVTAFSIVRFGSATHTVNTDQRRIGLTPTATAGGYQLTIPADPGIAVPGNYMLFAMDAAGVPSVAKIIKIGA